MTKRHRWNERQKLIRAGLPIPEELQIKRKPTKKPDTACLRRPFSEFEALEWAPWQNWRCIDKTGDAWAYENKPEKKRDATGQLNNYGVWAAPGRVQFLGEFEFSGPWQETLRGKHEL